MLADNSADDDPKQWFARVYQYVTEEMISAASGSVHSSSTSSAEDSSSSGLWHWTTRLGTRPDPRLHDYYERNLTAHRTGGDVEPAWAKTWSTAEVAGSQTSPRAGDEVPAVRVSAHIDADLPRALADDAPRTLPRRRPARLPSRLPAIGTGVHHRVRPVACRPAAQPQAVVDTALASRVHPQFRDSMLARNGYDVGRHRVKNVRAGRRRGPRSPTRVAVACRSRFQPAWLAKMPAPGQAANGHVNGMTASLAYAASSTRVHGSRTLRAPVAAAAVDAQPQAGGQ